MEFLNHIQIKAMLSSNSFSETTARMHRMLLRALIMQSAIPMVCIFLPIVLVGCMIPFLAKIMDTKGVNIDLAISSCPHDCVPKAMTFQ